MLCWARSPGAKEKGRNIRDVNRGHLRGGGEKTGGEDLPFEHEGGPRF